jgi:hypothetical protein
MFTGPHPRLLSQFWERGVTDVDSLEAVAGEANLPPLALTPYPLSQFWERELRTSALMTALLRVALRLVLSKSELLPLNRVAASRYDPPWLVADMKAGW